jgi:hypothetical protein
MLPSETSACRLLTHDGDGAESALVNRALRDLHWWLSILSLHTIADNQLSR